MHTCVKEYILSDSISNRICGPQTCNAENCFLRTVVIGNIDCIPITIGDCNSQLSTRWRVFELTTRSKILWRERTPGLAKAAARAASRLGCRGPRQQVALRRPGGRPASRHHQHELLVASEAHIEACDGCSTHCCWLWRCTACLPAHWLAAWREGFTALALQRPRPTKTAARAAVTTCRRFGPRRSWSDNQMPPAFKCSTLGEHTSARSTFLTKCDA